MTLEFEIEAPNLSESDVRFSFLELSGRSQGREDNDVPLGENYSVNDQVSCKSTSSRRGSSLVVTAMCDAKTDEAMDQKYSIWVYVLGMNIIASTTFIYEPPRGVIEAPPFSFRPIH